jgi:hypothetical protein
MTNILPVAPLLSGSGDVVQGAVLGDGAVVGEEALGFAGGGAGQFRERRDLEPTRCDACDQGFPIWINGGFGAGKTTLAEELHRRLPDAVVYNPADVGLMLWKWMPPNGDFQHLPSWRELVVATALSLRRHHAHTLSSDAQQWG